ncbi:hypothetical protein [Enhygromyxa salina]|nr:hypothetical protein [Enhygromyxa salina]
MKLDTLGVVSLDFKGGWKVRVEKRLEAELGGVELKFIGLRFTADSPVLGEVTLTQNEEASDPLSPLEIVKTQPPLFRNTLHTSVNVTIEKPPGGGPPLALAGTELFTQINNQLTVFPPQGAVYQLVKPVDLAVVGEPSKVVAQFLQFPATISHNP